MERFKKVYTIGVFFIVILGAVACTQDDNVVYIDDDEQLAKRPFFCFFCKENAIGDLAYMDDFYAGVANTADLKNAMLSLVTIPEDTSKLCNTFANLYRYYPRDSMRRTLLVIANDNYEDYVEKYTTKPESDSTAVLLAESKRTLQSAYTLNIPSYGAYYQAGIVVGKGMKEVERVLIVLANPHNSELRDMQLGFEAGLKESGRKVQCDSIYLTENNGGYDMADSTYKMSSTIDTVYQMVLPLCGGSAQGFLRYTREHPLSLQVIGVDTDMQRYSSSVPFSVVKLTGDAIQQWISGWMQGDEMPRHTKYGLDSGHISLIFANDDAVSDSLRQISESYLQEAIAKEEAYEGK